MSLSKGLMFFKQSYNFSSKWKHLLIGTRFLTAPDSSGGVNQVSNARALSLSAQALSLLRYNRQVVLVTVVQYNDSISAYVTNDHHDKSLSPRVCANSYALSCWWYPTITSSVASSSSSLQSFPASGSFPVSWLFPSGGQRIGASASVLSMNI